MRKLVKISELIFDMELYPRLKVGWLTAYQYSQAMKSGSEFPPIVVGLFKRKMYVVDGWHRIEATKLMKEEYIEAHIHKYTDKQAMFLEAVRRNISHGRPISVQEKVRLIEKLKGMDFTLVKISEIIKVPMNKIELLASRTIIAPNGKSVHLKSVIAKISGDKKDLLAIDMSKFSVRDVRSLLEQVVELLRHNLFPLDDDEIKELAVELHRLLETKLQLVVVS